MDIEKATREGKYFLSGILNLQKGIKIINTKPILSDAIRIGGTELFNANLVTGKALPCAAIINSKINKCFKGIISLRKDQEMVHRKYKTKLFLLLYNL